MSKLLGSRSVLWNLRQLCALERPPREERFYDDKTIEEIKVLRNDIPLAVLGHYDRLRLRGKHSVSPVSNDSCGACGKQVASPDLIQLQQSGGIGLCDHCTTFIFYSDTDADEYSHLK